MDSSTMSTVLMFGVMILVFYFFLIRPENKKKKAAEAMRNALQVGDEITTIGGIMGKVAYIKDNSIVIETSEDRVRVELTKWSVSTNDTAAKAAAKEREEAVKAKKKK